MLNFRSELKEIDAVMAATEKSYTAYCALAQPILNLINQNSIPVPAEITPLENPDSELTTTFDQITDLINEAHATETLRITRARAEYETQSAHIQRKSKQIYAAMNEEKKSVDAYAALLQTKIQDLEEQFVLQIKIGGMGIGL